MPEEATQVLAQFAAALTYEQLPDQVKEHCKNLLLDALACALAGHQGEETQQVAALASSLAQSQRNQRDRRRPPLARRRDVAQRLSRSPPSPCATRIAPRMTHVTPGGDAARPGDRRTRRAVRAAICWSRLPPGCEATTRIGDRARLSGVPRPRLPRTRRARAVRRGGCGRTAARLRRRDHGEAHSASPGSQAAGTFAAWGTPTVKFHQCRGALSGLLAALLAEQKFVATREFLTAKDGGLYNSLRQRRQARARRPPISAGAGSSSRSRCGCGRRPRSMQGMNTALFDLARAARRSSLRRSRRCA